MNNLPILFNFINHLSLHNQPFILRHNGKAPEWDDENLHQQAYNYNPELYALFSTIETVTPEQRLRILFQLLKASRKGFSHNLRLTLEQIISRKRAFLTQYQSRFELLPGQTGALFILGDKLAGIEIVPNTTYFQEVWMSLVCFSYDVAAMHFEKENIPQQITPFSASNLAELRQQLVESRQQMYAEVQSNLANTPPEKFEVTKQENFLDLQLKTVEGTNFAGEFVEEDGNLIYASVFAKSEYVLTV